jgi:cellulose synthase (UDP-forming)
MLLNGAIGVMLERKQRRNAPRMPAHYPAQLLVDGQPPRACSIDDLSSTGIKLDFQQALAPCGETARLRVRVEAIGREVELPLHTQWQTASSAGFRFAPRTQAQRREVVALAYGDSERWVRFRQAREARSKNFFGALWFIATLGFHSMRAHMGVLARDAVTLMLKDLRMLGAATRRAVGTRARAWAAWALAKETVLVVKSARR